MVSLKVSQVMVVMEDSMVWYDRAAEPTRSIVAQQTQILGSVAQTSKKVSQCLIHNRGLEPSKVGNSMFETDHLIVCLFNSLLWSSITFGSLFNVV